MNPLSTVRTTALTGLACSILAAAPCTSLYADEFTSDSEEPATATLHSVEENRDFYFPAGYMDRSPKRHRVAVKEFCTNGVLNLTDEALFKNRAAVVHKFNLSTFDAISLDKDYTGRKKQHNAPATKKKVADKRIKKRWLKLNAL